MPVSPLKAIGEIYDNPLYYVRHHLDDIYGCGLYEVAIPRNYDWAACFIDDADIPGTRKHRDEMKVMRELDLMPEVAIKASKKQQSRKVGGR